MNRQTREIDRRVAIRIVLAAFAWLAVAPTWAQDLYSGRIE
jgi:hypothetical protein